MVKIAEQKQVEHIFRQHCCLIQEQYRMCAAAGVFLLIQKRMHIDWPWLLVVDDGQPCRKSTKIEMVHHWDSGGIIILLEGTEDIYFMFNRNIDLNYDDLLANYHEAMEYISKNSDSFQVISKLRKPYSKLPPNFEHQKIMQSLEPFIEQYFVGIKEWPGTISKDNHTVMIAYRLCPESQSVLKGMPNFLLPLQNNLPNDICFLRNQKPWFATVSHEKIAFAISATKEDILFFREKGIRIYD